MRIAAIIISCLLCACGSATTPDFDRLSDGELGQGKVSIAYLKSLGKGRSTLIDSDIFIEGTVIATDWLGEFYKTIVVADRTGGIEIGIDIRHLYEMIPVTAGITVSCNGLWLGRAGSKTELGAAPTGEYATDRIAAADIWRYIRLSEPEGMPDPLEITISELSADHLSQFVCIRDLTVVEDERGKAWCDRPDADYDDDQEEDAPFLTYTDRHFIDKDGNMLTARTLDRCEYRNEPLPTGNVTLAGIVDLADGEFVLRIINRYVIF